MVQQAYKEQPKVSPEPLREIKPNNPSIMRLFSDLLQETTSLVHNEASLVRAEISQKVVQVQTGAVSLIIGAVFGIPALTVLLVAGVLGLTHVLAPWLSALIVGGAAAIVALIFLMVGRAKLNAKQLAPEHTAASLKEDRRLIQEHTR
ncbi:phage holin family protein [Nitrococcus mobilis]|uniref:Phage holin family protein n=1 Tax=Nitrococcus mobilis Nb-231 TaxID=314278 RepID=A4BTE0_9GAMM|nr:phage holin family protein [Nitrococcus mobilis]EAR21042.1 hypothetical protein NB231_07727 [Nitrococcus mobilis Nb-231]